VLRLLYLLGHVLDLEHIAVSFVAVNRNGAEFVKHQKVLLL
jgi:hypothetical protein